MHDLPIFLFSLLALGQTRAEHVKPAISALFVDTVGQSLTDLQPILYAKNCYLFLKNFVLLCRP